MQIEIWNMLGIKQDKRIFNSSQKNRIKVFSKYITLDNITYSYMKYVEDKTPNAAYHWKLINVLMIQVSNVTYVRLFNLPLEMKKHSMLFTIESWSIKVHWSRLMVKSRMMSSYVSLSFEMLKMFQLSVVQ